MENNDRRAYYESQFAKVDAPSEYPRNVKVYGGESGETFNMNLTEPQYRAIRAVMVDGLDLDAIGIVLDAARSQWEYLAGFSDNPEIQKQCDELDDAMQALQKLTK